MAHDNQDVLEKAENLSGNTIEVLGQERRRVMLRNKHLQAYLENGFDEIEGWCSHGLFEIVDLLDSAEINRAGGCVEIGVHHGKFYCLLNSVIDETFESYAIDIFDNQALNIDFSGGGNLEIFQQNLAKFDRHGGGNTRVIQGDSTDRKICESFKGHVGSIRFLSVDGGHTAEHTVSDLTFANLLASNEGVVILDDILNEHWLGVIEGAVTFLKTKPTLVPFAIGHNKLLFSKLSYYKYYFDLFNESQLRSKVVGFFGHRIVAL